MVDLVLLILKSLAILLMRYYQMIKSGMEILKITNAFNIIVFFIFSFPPRCPDPPLTLADPLEVKNAVKCLRGAKRPLIIIGKGKS